MTEQFVDEVSLTLGVSCGSTDTSLSLAGSFAALPASGTYSLLIDAELITVGPGARAGGVVPVTRGENGTTPLSHSAGAPVIVSLTSRALNQLKADTVVQPKTIGAVAYPALTYNVLPTDWTTILDTSGWVAQAAIVLVLPAAPFIGERHSFNEDGWIVGRPPWLVNGGNNPLQPYSQNVQTSKPRANDAPGVGANVAAVQDLGARAAWVWTGAIWARD